MNDFQIINLERAATGRVACDAVSVPEDGLRFGRLCGNSEAMRAVYWMIERVAPTDATVIVLGVSLKTLYNRLAEYGSTPCTRAA